MHAEYLGKVLLITGHSTNISDLLFFGKVFLLFTFQLIRQQHTLYEFNFIFPLKGIIK